MPGPCADVMPNDNAKVIAAFRKGAGATAEEWRATGTTVPPQEILILHTIGATSGLERLTPLRYRTVDGRFVVFASNGGQRSNPKWFRNLMAHPKTLVEVESGVVAVEASVAAGPERRRIWADLLAVYPHFHDYQVLAGREIPVVLLTPTG